MTDRCECDTAGRGSESAQHSSVNIALTPRTVLIIDDDESIRFVAARMVQRLGYAVLEAADGQAGVEVYAEHADTIVCVLLDVAMPVKSGAQALCEMRQIRGNAPVALMSGYTREETATRFMHLQPTAYLHKPFSSADLEACLDKVTHAPR